MTATTFGAWLGADTEHYISPPWTSEDHTAIRTARRDRHKRREHDTTVTAAALPRLEELLTTTWCVRSKHRFLRWLSECLPRMHKLAMHLVPRSRRESYGSLAFLTSALTFGNVMTLLKDGKVQVDHLMWFIRGNPALWLRRLSLRPHYAPMEAVEAAVAAWRVHGTSPLERLRNVLSLKAAEWCGHQYVQIINDGIAHDLLISTLPSAKLLLRLVKYHFLSANEAWTIWQRCVISPAYGAIWTREIRHVRRLKRQATS